MKPTKLVIMILIYPLIITLVSVGIYFTYPTITGLNIKRIEVVKDNLEIGGKGQAFIKDSSEMNTVYHVALNSINHSTLVKAVQAAELENSLVNAGPLTVFAPTNNAFSKLPQSALEDLLKKENKEKLAFILQHHVTPGNYSRELIKKFNKLGQASNEYVLVEVKGSDVYVGESKIISSFSASNGTVHIVDKVLLPE